MADACVESREPVTTAARRRRREIQRLTLVAGADSMESLDESRQSKKCKNQATDHQSDSDLASDTNPSHGMTSVIGGRRDMEDAVSIRTDFLDFDSGDKKKHHFFGVFDGHGCSHVAALCGDRMHEIVAEELKNSESDSPNWKEAMEASFARMDAEAEAFAAAVGTENSGCRCELRSPKCNHVGSTAVVAVVSSDRIVAANCGDSRVVLSRKGAALPLSVDHKPDRPDELRRIEASGGRVIYWDGARVLGVLAMSRAIGDCYLKPFVISEPEVTEMERTDEDECLILASDGLWDVVSNETACNIARMCLHGDSGDSDKACSDAAMVLTKLALARQSADNVSVVVVDLRREL